MAEPQIKRKVDFDIFSWVTTALASVMLVISGYLFNELTVIRTDLAESSARNEGLIKELAAKLEAEKEKNTGVLVTLAEIRGDIKLVKDQLERVPKK